MIKEEPIFFEATEARKEYLESLNLLLPQLSTTAKPLTQEAFERLVTSTNSHLYFIQLNERIIGMCTLALYEIPTGCRAWIEDVVVDKEFRGMKFGKLLIERVIEDAKRFAPCTMMLTSRPSRVAANKLYQSIGFEPKETNVYKMTIKK